MNGRRSRVARKASHVVQTELDREFNSGIAALKKERDEAFRQANAAHEKSIETARDARTKARVAAAKVYDEGRTELLKRLAASERAAA